MTATMTAASLVIVVPMVPDAAAGPNRGKRNHWAKQRAINELEDCAWKATLAMREAPDFAAIQEAAARSGLIMNLEIAWCCGRKRMDDDNAIAACKGLRDGVAAGLGINDRQIRQGEMRQVRGDGSVTVTLREAT